MTAVGLEPTQLALVELESTPLDHSGKLSMQSCYSVFLYAKDSMTALRARQGLAAGPKDLRS